MDIEVISPVIRYTDDLNRFRLEVTYDVENNWRTRHEIVPRIDLSEEIGDQTDSVEQEYVSPQGDWSIKVRILDGVMVRWELQPLISWQLVFSSAGNLTTIPALITTAKAVLTAQSVAWAGDKLDSLGGLITDAITDWTTRGLTSEAP